MTDKEIISEVNRCISMEADAIGKLTEVLDEKAVLETAKVLQNCKGKLIGVSENPDSKIAQAADIYMKVKAEREPCRFNMLATSSTLAVISTFDAICIALMQMTGYTREQFAVIHPGGAVGERLLNHID